MKKDFLDLLSLSAGERKGVIVLVIIILVLSAVQLYMAFHKSPPASFNDSTFFHITVSEPDDNEVAELTGFQFAPVTDTFELFEFDPNKIDAGDLIRLGIHERVIRTWLNYRLHGGRFYKPQDISKIYGLSPETAERIIPYVRIGNYTGGTGQLTRDLRKDIPEKKSINTGDSVDFMAIPGIGPVLSRRIIKYRKMLGGYYRMEQLKEVYGLNDSVISEVTERFYADTLLIVKISMNEATEAEIRRHPYIGVHIAGGIIEYRKQTGQIKSINELVTNGILTKEEFERLKPYLGL